MIWRLVKLLLAIGFAIFAYAAGAEVRLDIEKELRRSVPAKGEKRGTHIPGARYRVAVFAFEDPDATGLGNALASLLGREILLNSNVGSIGVLRYESGLAPSADLPLSYFDKVERLTESQDVTIAVWGMLRVAGATLWIDTYAQLPPKVVRENFSWHLRLPPTMGSGSLIAHVRPSRVLVQRHEMVLTEAQSLATSAETVDRLRLAPNDNAPVVATLPMGSVYWVTRSQGEWTEVSTGKESGWVRSAGHCTRGCAPLLDAARFSSGLLEFIATRRLRQPAATLERDAQAVYAQISTLESLSTPRPRSSLDSILARSGHWFDPPRGTELSAVGAAFANIRALADVAAGLNMGLRGQNNPPEGGVSDARLDPVRVRQIAFELAKSSLADPRNTDVLQNLSILFRYAGDHDRAGIAQKLAVEAREAR